MFDNFKNIHSLVSFELIYDSGIEEKVQIYNFSNRTKHCCKWNLI